MKKLLGVLSLAAIFTFNLFGQEINRFDEDFVKENTSTTTYKEWTGSYAPSEINTASQIMDIGRRLGKGISYQEKVQNDPNPYNKGNPAYKYSSARIYGKTKRGADLLLIGSTATVDTIKCLKMIIRGYLETAFSYNPEEAKILAEKICYWNTNNFENLEYFDSVFESDVKKVFEGRYERMGLSSSYQEWKKSILIIPHEFTAPAVSESDSYTEPSDSAVNETPSVYEDMNNETETSGSFETEESGSSSYESEESVKPSYQEAAPVREPVKIASKKSPISSTVILISALGLLVIAGLVIIFIKLLK